MADWPSRAPVGAGAGRPAPTAVPRGAARSGRRGAPGRPVPPGRPVVRRRRHRRRRRRGSVGGVAGGDGRRDGRRSLSVGTVGGVWWAVDPSAGASVVGGASRGRRRRRSAASVRLVAAVRRLQVEVVDAGALQRGGGVRGPDLGGRAAAVDPGQAESPRTAVSVHRVSGPGPSRRRRWRGRGCSPRTRPPCPPRRCRSCPRRAGRRPGRRCRCRSRRRSAGPRWWCRRPRG